MTQLGKAILLGLYLNHEIWNKQKTDQEKRFCFVVEHMFQDAFVRENPTKKHLVDNYVPSYFNDFRTLITDNINQIMP